MLLAVTEIKPDMKRLSALLIVLCASGCANPHFERWRPSGNPMLSGFCEKLNWGFKYDTLLHHNEREAVFKSQDLEFSLSDDRTHLNVISVSNCKLPEVTISYDLQNNDTAYIDGPTGQWIIRQRRVALGAIDYDVRDPAGQQYFVPRLTSRYSYVDDLSPAIAPKGQFMYLMGDKDQVLTIYVYDLVRRRALYFKVPLADAMSLGIGKSEALSSE